MAIPILFQVLFPLEVCELLDKVDLEVTVEGPGLSSQAGAVRLAISMAVAPLVDEENRTKLRIGACLANGILADTYFFAVMSKSTNFLSFLVRSWPLPARLEA